jgi:hypothetical protein
LIRVNQTESNLIKPRKVIGEWLLVVSGPEWRKGIRSGEPSNARRFGKADQSESNLIKPMRVKGESLDRGGVKTRKGGDRSRGERNNRYDEALRAGLHTLARSSMVARFLTLKVNPSESNQLKPNQTEKGDL